MEKCVGRFDQHSWVLRFSLMQRTTSESWLFILDFSPQKISTEVHEKKRRQRALYQAEKLRNLHIHGPRRVSNLYLTCYQNTVSYCHSLNVCLEILRTRPLMFDLYKTPETMKHPFFILLAWFGEAQSNEKLKTSRDQLMHYAYVG